MDLVKDIVAISGGLAQVALLVAFFRWLRGPTYIPFDAQHWPRWALALREEYDAHHVIDYEREDYLAQGLKPARRGLLRREVRARRKVGYAVLMRKGQRKISIS